MTTGTVCLHTLILLYIFRLSYTILDYGPWSSCSKSCDIGTRTRTSNSGLIEEEFCNLHFCPRSCDYSFDCGGSISVKCKNHTCICNKGDDFDKITCKPSVGSCIIRDDPPSAIGFRDPTAKYPKYGYNLESCTTNDNSNYEVHIIEIYGDRLKNIYEIFVVPRGPVNKPIILFLKSYESTKWKIDTSVGIYKVFYTGYHIDSSSVVKLSSSRCDVPIFTSHYDYEVVKLMRQISKDFGPVTSYTYYYKLDTESPKIILQVGGSPLQVFQRTYMYNVSQSCSNGNVACPEYYSETNNFAMQREWTQWTECSKSCNIGTQNRCRFVPGKDTIDNEERYCNTQFCPIRKACAFNYECMARGTCYGGQCQCKLGDGYNIYTCLPEIYNCSIRENSIMALGYKDSTTSKSYSSYSLHSCTTVGNNKNEVHVIGIYGNRKQNTYTINVISRGPVTKPIILVLSSYEVTHWKINSTVDVAEVLYRGSMSSVEKACNHSFDFKVTYKDDLPFDYGSDAVELLKYVGKVYGSVTSFTGYYHIKSENPAIILNVGGDPMKVLPRNYIYKPDGINVEAPTNANEMSTDVLFTVSGNLETDPSAASTTTGPVRWNITNAPERHDITCSVDSMSVYVPMSVLSTNDLLTWRDPHCQVSNNGTHFVSTIQHSACGTTVSFNTDEVIFENELIIHKQSPQSLIQLNDTAQIDFGLPNNDIVPVRCVYPRNMNVTTSYRPAQSHIRFYEKRYGHLDVVLEQFKTDQFLTELPGRSYPREVELNKDLFFKLRASHVNSSDVALKVDSCIATPSLFPASSQTYELIKQGCPASPAVKLFASSFDEVRFSVRAFEFRKSPGGVVYIHCQVSLCFSASPQCVTGCSSRHRREAVGTDGPSQLISGGPYMVVADEGSIQASTVVAAVCACIAVISTVFAVVGWKRKTERSAA